MKNDYYHHEAEVILSTAKKVRLINQYRIQVEFLKKLKEKGLKNESPKRDWQKWQGNQIH